MENDGLNKWQRYRLKDVEGYRKRKAEYARTPEERAKRTAYMQKWREKNRTRHNAQANKSHHRNKWKHVDRCRNYALLRSVGISLKEKIEMVARQGGRCAICEKEFTSTRSTHVDHCHRTGKIRAILCHVCNTKLGWYESMREKINTYVDTTW